MMNLKPDDESLEEEDIRQLNRAAWDNAVAQGARWTRPVSTEQVAQAREGRWQLYLTPQKPVPRAWFGDLSGKQVLCLASGGGQQAPLLAAAGATVTCLDNSPRQLAQDAMVATRDGLSIRTLEGDMRDLSALESDSIDLIVHPVSNLFVPDVRPVWLECARVLRPGGTLLAGFNNPCVYIFDAEAAERGKMVVKHPLPYSDLQLPAAQQRALAEQQRAFEFSHTFESQLAGQLEAGLCITGFYEDSWDTPQPYHPWDAYFPSFFATKAEKLPRA